MDLQLLCGFHFEVNVVNVRLTLVAVEQALAAGVIDFIGHFTQYVVAADDESVVLTSQERQHQFGVVSRDENGAVVVVVLNISIQRGQAILLRERTALSISSCREQPEGQRSMSVCFIAILLLVY